MSFIMSDVIGRVPTEDDSSVIERGGKGALRKLFHPLCGGAEGLRSMALPCYTEPLSSPICFRR